MPTEEEAELHRQIRGAVAFSTGIPVEEVAGYVVLAIKPEGGWQITSSCCCELHEAAVLSKVVGAIMVDLDCGGAESPHK